MIKMRFNKHMSLATWKYIKHQHTDLRLTLLNILQEQKVLLEGREAIRYDVLSIDVGITPSGQGIKGSLEFSTPVKPVSRYSASASLKFSLQFFQEHPYIPYYQLQCLTFNVGWAWWMSDCYCLRILSQKYFIVQLCGEAECHQETACLLRPSSQGSRIFSLLPLSWTSEADQAEVIG